MKSMTLGGRVRNDVKTKRIPTDSKSKWRFLLSNVNSMKRTPMEKEN